MKPEEDNIVIFDTTMTVEGETVKADSIYAKSINGLLGQFYDLRYGTIKAGYICQYYPSAGFDVDSMMKDEIDSIRLYIFYKTYFGDSLSPMEVSVYPAIKPLDKHYYSNIQPELYCDMNSLMGKQIYTARNLNISDSINIAGGYQKYISIPLPNELGQKFLEEYKKPDHGAYASPSAMADFFPGTYLASTFGSGCLIEIEDTEIDIYYQRFCGQTVDGTDSIRSQVSVLSVTKEIVQLNTYTSEYDEELQKENNDTMFLKTPGGVFSKITIPIRKIKETIGNRKFSNVKLSISAYPKEDREYVWDFPGSGVQNTTTLTTPKLLLIEPKEVQSFFEGQKNADSQTTYYTTFNTSSYAYVFDNISNVVQKAIDEDAETDLELLLIPVLVSYYSYTDPYTYSTYLVDYVCANYLVPSAVALKKGGDNLKIQIVAADLDVNRK
jgi:hypothetical protein